MKAGKNSKILNGPARRRFTRNFGVPIAAALAGILPAHAQDATWTGASGNDFSNPANWSPNIVPTGTATFGNSSVTTVTSTAIPVNVQELQFSSGAPRYNFTNLGVVFTGTGIVNNGLQSPSFTYNNSGASFGSLNLLFENASSAANATVLDDFGRIEFANTSSAANAQIQSNRSQIYFFDGSTAATSNILNAGTVQFGSPGGSDMASAGNATISNDSGPPGIVPPANVLFYAHTTAGNATFKSGDLAYVTFYDYSTAGNATLILNDGITIQFRDHSTGGNAQFEINGGLSQVDFSYSTGPNGNNQLSAGSLFGAGTVYLGSNQLAVGSNNLSTTYSAIFARVKPLDDGLWRLEQSPRR